MPLLAQQWKFKYEEEEKIEKEMVSTMIARVRVGEMTCC